MRDPCDIEGYFAPVRQALTQPILIGGAPRSYAILNGTIAACIVFSGWFAAGIVVGIAGHFLGVLLARKDPDAVDALKSAIRLPARLEP